MFEVFILLGVCSCLAFLYDKTCRVHKYEENGFLYSVKYDTVSSKCVIIVLLIVMICFAGLRTRMNDTATYLTSFAVRIPDSISEIASIDWSVGANPFFVAYQIIVKSFITDSGYGFLFLTSTIVVTSMVVFLKKHSVEFSFSVFLFITFTVYAFTMAAMKQTLATAIGIWAIALYIRGKRVLPALVILFAMMIHPYVLIFFTIYFMSKNIWDYRSLILIIIALIAGFFFTNIVDRLMDLSSALGDEYDMSLFYGSGVNRFRLIIYAIGPTLTFLNRRKIRNLGTRFDFLCVNFSIISMCFMIFASFGGANMIGRLANYFDIFTCLSIPIAFKYWEYGKVNRLIARFIIIIGFCLFYFTYYNQYATAWSVPWYGCIYDHISIFTLLSNW